MESMLPPELYGEVLTHIHESDTATLRNCALTCHAFRPASQKKLFSAVYFNHKCERKPERFHELLLSESGTRLADYVQRFENVQFHSSTHPDTLPAILPFFHNILEFHLGGHWIGWPAFPSSLQYALLDCFFSNQITHLNVWGISGFPLSLLNCFSHLKHLNIALSHPELDAAKTNPPRDVPNGPVKLDTLSLGPRSESLDIINWMCNDPSSRFDLSTLRGLAWRDLGVGFIPLHKFSNLHHLVMVGTTCKDNRFFSELQELPHLETLEMGLQYFFAENSSQHPFSFHPQNTFRILILDLDTIAPTANAPSWSNIDNILAESHLPCLQTVVIRGQNALTFETLIQQSFKGLYIRDALQIVNGRAPWFDWHKPYEFNALSRSPP